MPEFSYTGKTLMRALRSAASVGVSKNSHAIWVRGTHISNKGAERLENPERMYMMSLLFGCSL
ncbi:MAG: hypothetical protein DMG31_05580 [Acidobacteria bacterium]|nr:MAG: hypothetical protein DMG31_05580 [Acidobacteriota bacterium]